MAARQTYTFPIQRVGSIAEPQAWENLKGVGVTGFSSYQRAQALYLGSLFASILLIILDALTMWTMTRHTGTVGTTASIVSNENTWGVSMAAVLIACDVLVMVTQGIDLAYFHFTAWPLTALTWFGQLNGTGISSAIVGMFLYYPHADVAMRDEKMSVAFSSFALHALFISSQFSVTLEYIIRKLDGQR